MKLIHDQTMEKVAMQKAMTPAETWSAATAWASCSPATAKETTKTRS